MDVGEITWDISPALPSELSLDTITGTITGTPPGSQGAGQYTVYANSSTTSYSRTFNLSLNSFMTNLTNATSCVASPSLPNGLNIDSSTCTISGTPTVATSNMTYTVTANISNVTYQTTVWLSSAYLPLTPSVEGAELILDEAMTNITFQYNASAASGATSCVASPSLPNGLNIDSSTCTISGTPTVATTNTSYNVTAVIGGTTFQTAVWFSTSYLELTPSVEGAELSPR